MGMPRVLVIDDDAIVRATVVRMLLTAGYDGVEAAGGKAGLAVMAANPCEIVITDVFMPLQDGIETIVELKRSFPLVPVIAISGGKARGLYSPLKDAATLGADVTLEKPFTIGALVGAVRDLLKDPAPRAPDARAL